MLVLFQLSVLARAIASTVDIFVDLYLLVSLTRGAFVTVKSGVVNNIYIWSSLLVTKRKYDTHGR